VPFDKLRMTRTVIEGRRILLGVTGGRLVEVSAYPSAVPGDEVN